MGGSSAYTLGPVTVAWEELENHDHGQAPEDG